MAFNPKRFLKRLGELSRQFAARYGEGFIVLEERDGNVDGRIVELRKAGKIGPDSVVCVLKHFRRPWPPSSIFMRHRTRGLFRRSLAKNLRPSATN
jgi:hypothetical protein